MPHRLRKIRKQRGSRTHGWGQVGQHRGQGMRGGSGKTGLQKHKWTYTIKYQPQYFGKKGFKRPWSSKIETINVGDLDQNIEFLLKDGLAEKRGKKTSVNLDDMDVQKLLGSGKVTQPLLVTVRNWSSTAAKKIEEAGGKIFFAIEKSEIE
jgi:large subunit ribosomal protein L15